MAQLIMRWKNDKTPAKPLVFPQGVTLKTMPKLENGVAHWLEIVKFMWQEPKDLSEDYYHRAMTDRPCYREEQCHFLLVDGEPAATITVICDYSTKEGYIHMVSAKPQFRGRGLGHLLNDVATMVLKREEMETAYLTTDDWRIPAIKSYLKAGFYPDLETEPDFKERWEKIYREISR